MKCSNRVRLSLPSMKRAGYKYCQHRRFYFLEHTIERAGQVQWFATIRNLDGEFMFTERNYAKFQAAQRLAAQQQKTEIHGKEKPCFK